MRKMLSTKAGATFSLDSPELTFAVRKDVVEIIYKVKPGVYMVVNFARVDATRGLLFELLTGDDKDGIMEMEFGLSADDAEHGFGMEIGLSDKLPLLLSLNPAVINKAGALRKKMLTIYNELVTNPPFPAWKFGLDEVWE